MPIPLKIHEIRLQGSDTYSREELYEDTPAIDRFSLVLAQIKAILSEAQNDPDVLYLITSPEGCISSHFQAQTFATEQEYQLMISTLKALISKTTNVLLMPGTIVYPVIKDNTKVFVDNEQLFRNIAPIFYQNHTYEYQQSIVPDIGLKEAPTVSYPKGRLLTRQYKLLEEASEPVNCFEFEFKGQRFKLYPQICIEHHADTLKTLKDLELSHSLQVILSGSVKHKDNSVRAGFSVHTDINRTESMLNMIDNASVFELQSIKRHDIEYDWINYFADVSKLAPVASLFCKHWATTREPKIQNQAPSMDFNKALSGLK